MEVFQKIFNLAKRLFTVKKQKEEDMSSNQIEEFQKKVNEYIALIPHPGKFILKYITDVYKDMIKSVVGKNINYNQLLQSINSAFDAMDENVNAAEKAMKSSKKIQKMIKFIKMLIKILNVIAKAIVSLIQAIAPLLPYIAIALVVIVLIWGIFSLLPSLGNLFSFSYEFDKTSYYDTELFQSVKNKELMEENLYERTGETSYYQRFVDAEIKDFAIALLPKELQDENDSRPWSKRVEEAAKEFTGFYSLDSRLTLHDANLNGMSAFLQANTISSKLEQSADVQGYLRDYFNKETNFELSNQFLMQLNNKAFANYGNEYNEQLVYPEIFTKPVAYVYDFNRMELLREYNSLEQKYEYNWDEYTYVTQRVTHDDVGKNVSDILVNYNELEWGKYYGINTTDGVIKPSDEGKIISFPSPIVWEYVIKDKDDYHLYQQDPNKDPAIVTNKYHSEYLLFKNDETGQELIPKFYYKIVSLDNGTFQNNGNIDTTTGSSADKYIFDGPYMVLNNQDVNSSNIDSAFDQSYKVKRTDENGIEKSDGLWFKLTIPKGYRLIDDVSAVITDENGIETNQPRTKDEVLVNANFNSEPKKHLQLAHLVGNNGDIAVSSQNLINYKYFKFKTISESYRNKQDYVDGWASYISDNEDFFTTYSDSTFWGALWNRVSSIGSIFDNVKNIENDLDSPEGEDQALFNMVSTYPEKALNLSLYLYEQEFKRNHTEGDETWKYDYSVNNYFRTDNNNFENLEDYQKFFYILEELKLSLNNSNTPTNDLITQALSEFTSINYDGVVLNKGVGELIVEMTNDMTKLDGETKKALQVIANKMSTRYLNLGQTKTDLTGNVLGEQISLYSGNRLGEVSLESTLAKNSDLHKETISFSQLNEKNKDPENDISFDFSYKTWSSAISDWWDGLWGGDKDSSISETVIASAEEHSHLQNDYYIKEDNLNLYSSNIFDAKENGNELPLEIKSVRDYGLGSVLNYVDSVVVEYQSGMIYDENYLKTEIGVSIKNDYDEVYKDYNVQNVDEIGEGYFPKEMKDQGSDELIELFAMNNTKELFKSLVEALDGKIMEISADYDTACKDPERKGIINALNMSINDDLDYGINLSINGNFDGATGSGSASISLAQNIQSNGFGNITIDSVVGDAHIQANDTDTFKYYTPSLTGPNSLSQLVLPKRYYRSWLDKDDTTGSKNSIKDWVKINLKNESLLIRKSNELPDLISVIAGAYKNKGINSNYNSAYNLVKTNGKLNGSSLNDYAQQLYNEEYNKKNFTEGLSGSYEYIKDSDLKKVYLIDEVVTFAGKFMYTYKDTLLTTTSSADENMPKSVIGSYATDRYIFLDSWDVKLLTDRIAKVDFMLFSVEGKINYNGEWLYISEYIDKVNDEKSSGFFGFAKHFLSTFNELQDTCKATYMFAVPSSFSDAYFESTGQELDDIFKDSTDDNGNVYKSQVFKELELYTQYIYNGFLFDQSLNASVFTNGGTVGNNVTEYNLMNGNQSWKASDEEIAEFQQYVKDNAQYSMSDIVGDMDFDSIETDLPSYDVHIYVKDNYPDTDNYSSLKSSVNKYLNGLSSGQFDDYTSEQWVSYVNNNYNDFGTQNQWASKSKVVKNIKKFFKDIDTNDFEDGEIANIIVNEMIAGSVYGYCNYHYHQLINGGEDSPGLTYQDELDSYLENFNGSTGNFLLDIFGAIQSFLNKLAQKVLDLVTGFEITSPDFNAKCVKFTNVLIGSQFLSINETDVQNYFNKYVKVLDSQVKEFSNEDYFTFAYKLNTGNGNEENGTGRCYTNKKLVRYTLKVSDEIAMDVENGRFYSQLSGYHPSSLGADISNTDIIEPTKSGYQAGELLYVKSNANTDSNETTAQDFSSTLINTPEFLSEYNKRANTTLSADDWNKIWNPQLKIFDNVNNTAYIKDTMKEYIFGGIKDNVDDDGNIYNSKGNMKGDYVKEIKNTANYFFFPSLRNASDYKFLDTLFNSNRSSGTTSVSNYLKGFKLQTEMLHPLYYIDNTGREHDTFKEKTESVNITDIGEAIVPSSKIDLTAFTETLDWFYSDKACELAQNTLANGKSLGTISDEDAKNFHITGFALVPRIVDRRDEPTIYPLYRYWGGAKKKIEPSEKIKYFEGQTYDTWLDKMKINEASDEEDLKYFTEEKTRLSEYLKSYLENFEAYVPYNIIADKDLEVRGTAGYGDLMTNYTLTPEYTTEYTQLFENEANKAYWKDILEKYDITSKDLAQLLQGVAEISLSTAGEDALRLLRAGSSPDDINSVKDGRIVSNEELAKPKPQDSVENKDILTRAILNTARGSSTTTVKLKDENGGETLYYLPIMGLCAIDDLREISEENDNQETIDNSEINNFDNFAFVGNFSNSIKSLNNNSTYLINDNTSSEMLNNSELSNIKNKKGIIIMMGAKDIITSSIENPDTGNYRRLILKLKGQNPEANIYIIPYPGFANYDEYNVETQTMTFTNGLSPKQAGTTYDFDSYSDLNTSLYKYNKKLYDFLKNEDNIEFLDFSSNFESGLGGISNTYTNGIYFNDNNLINLINDKFFSNNSQANLVLEKNVKSTKTINPKGDNFTAFETDLNILKNSNDSRLDPKISVQFLSLRLYKMTKSTGDLLKGINSYYYGVDFVQSLVAVTADNAKNLIENPEHGLWYNPTEQDIRRALGENVVLSDGQDTNLKDSFGAKKMKDTFSFVKNIENRKKIVIGSSNSVQLTGNTEIIELYKQYFENFGSQADSIKSKANKQISGQSKIENKTISGSLAEVVIERCEYISGTLSSEDQKNIILDPALFIAAFQQESGLDPNCTNGGLSQINSDKTTSYESNNGQISFSFSLSECHDPVASIEYTIVDFVNAMQTQFKDFNYPVCPAMVFKGHNAGYGNVAKVRKQYSEYSSTTSGDLDYLIAYENPEPANFSKGYDILSSIYGPNCLNHGYTLNVYISEMQARKKLGNYGDPLYTTHIMQYYIEDYSSGGVVSSGKNRDYIDELWESQYMKYQNTGVNLVVNHMNGDDIEDLINMTANYRNNNEEQNDYGYTYLDFFKNINKVKDKNTKEFTGQRDSLILNSMRYLGAHYSQGRSKDVSKVGVVVSRFANHDNLTSSSSATAKYTFSRWPYGNGFYYVEGENYYTAVPNLYGMDCSSFGSMMYIAMGYEFPGSTCAAMRSGFSQYPGNCITAEVNHDSNNLMTGDLLITTGHTMMWIGEYSNNYNDLFNEEDLLCTDPTLYWNTGPDALKWANANCVGKTDVIIHEGGSYNNHSCVNIKERPNVLNQGDCKVFRIFNDDVEYSQSAMEEAGMLCPTIFTKTTIQNNPYLVEYMENSGILEQELANGLFTMEDVESAKKAIAKARGDEEEDSTDYSEGEHYYNDENNDNESIEDEEPLIDNVPSEESTENENITE